LRTTFLHCCHSRRTHTALPFCCYTHIYLVTRATRGLRWLLTPALRHAAFAVPLRITVLPSVYAVHRYDALPTLPVPTALPHLRVGLNCGYHRSEFLDTTCLHPYLRRLTLRTVPACADVITFPRPPLARPHHRPRAYRSVDYHQRAPARRCWFAYRAACVTGPLHYAGARAFVRGCTLLLRCIPAVCWVAITTGCRTRTAVTLFPARAACITTVLDLTGCYAVPFTTFPPVPPRTRGLPLIADALCGFGLLQHACYRLDHGLLPYRPRFPFLAPHCKLPGRYLLHPTFVTCVYPVLLTAYARNTTLLRRFCICVGTNRSTAAARSPVLR